LSKGEGLLKLVRLAVRAFGKDAVEGAARDVTRDATKDATKDATRDATKDATKDAAKDYQSPLRGTKEYRDRLDELSKDPAHGGGATPKSIREGEIALDLERRGDLPGPVRRPDLDNTNPAFQVDKGDFVDATGQHWDLKSPADTFPSGPRAGQPMPPGLRGSYDGTTMEQEIDNELGKGQNVVINTENLSPAAQADLRNRVAGQPGWAGKVRWYP